MQYDVCAQTFTVFIRESTPSIIILEAGNYLLGVDRVPIGRPQFYSMREFEREYDIAKFLLSNADKRCE